MDDGQRTYRCMARRKLVSSPLEGTKTLVVGDEVIFTPMGSKKGIIENVLPRRSKLSRSSPTKSGKEKTVAANVDRVLIVASVKQPETPCGLVDRCLISSEVDQIQPILCFNKIDLADPADYVSMVDYYRSMDYEVFAASALRGDGIRDLSSALAGHRTVLAGQSGAGKSSIINRIDPRLKLRTKLVHGLSGEGRHATTWVSLLRLPNGGYVVDTPGVREFGLWDLRPEDIPSFFRDFFSLSADCAMRDCSHTHEEDCAVRRAVEEGRIPRWRYESYKRVMESLDKPEVFLERPVERRDQVPLKKRKPSRRSQKQRLRSRILDATVEDEDVQC